MGKTTDRLLAIARLSAEGNRQAAARELAKLRQFHLTEAATLARAAQAIRLDREILRRFSTNSNRSCAKLRNPVRSRRDFPMRY